MWSKSGRYSHVARALCHGLLRLESVQPMCRHLGLVSRHYAAQWSFVYRKTLSAHWCPRSSRKYLARRAQTCSPTQIEHARKRNWASSLKFEVGKMVISRLTGRIVLHNDASGYWSIRRSRDRHAYNPCSNLLTSLLPSLRSSTLSPAERRF